MPRRAVVVGASLSGLLSAAALVAPGRSVVILDRDDDPAPADAAAGPLPRPGVPQSRQPHVFLHRGLLAAEQLLPGLRGDLVRHGGLPFDTGTLPYHTGDGWLPLGGRAFEVVSATRPLLDAVVRSRVLALPGVELRWGTRAEGLVRAGDAWGVRTGGGTIHADLVVDASGRASRLPVWLRELGFAEPAVEEIDARLGYATRMYAGGREVLDAPGVVLQASPDDPVGGIALQMENRRWLVTAAGFGERRPPRDAEGFPAFLRALPDPALADLVARCTPIGNVVIYRQTANRRHRYERMAAWPDGLLTIGDALCTFDPVYGQGITVAALEAVALREALDRAASEGGMAAGYSAALLRRFASLVDLPWGVATGEDLRFMSDGSRQGLAQQILGAWARRLNRMAVHGNGRARFELAKMYHLMGSPLGLFHPALVAGMLRAAVIGEGPAAPRPDSLEALRAAALAG